MEPTLFIYINTILVYLEQISQNNLDFQVFYLIFLLHLNKTVTQWSQQEFFQKLFGWM